MVVPMGRGYQVRLVYRVLLWDGGQEGRLGWRSPDGVVGGSREDVSFKPLKVDIAEERRGSGRRPVSAPSALLALLPLLLLHQFLQKQRLLLKQQGPLLDSHITQRGSHAPNSTPQVGQGTRGKDTRWRGIGGQSSRW